MINSYQLKTEPYAHERNFLESIGGRQEKKKLSRLQTIDVSDVRIFICARAVRVGIETSWSAESCAATDDVKKMICSLSNTFVYGFQGEKFNRVFHFIFPLLARTLLLPFHLTQLSFSFFLAV